MAEKEISNLIKLQIEAGKATPAPPVGPALGGSGVNIMQFVKEFNDRTTNQAGFIIPVVITVYKDKSFSFITKVPPVAVLIKKAIKIEIQLTGPIFSRYTLDAIIAVIIGDVATRRLHVAEGNVCKPIFIATV